MSLKSLLKGVTCSKPDSLVSFIQDKTHSSFGPLRLLPFAFPVFIMNPVGYFEGLESLISSLQGFEGYTLDLKQFSNMLRENDGFAIAGDVDCTGPGSGEVWRIDKAAVHLSLGDQVEWFVENATDSYRIRESEANITFDALDGPVWLEEGDFLHLNWALNNSGNVYQIGVVKNA